MSSKRLSNDKNTYNSYPSFQNAVDPIPYSYHDSYTNYSASPKHAVSLIPFSSEKLQDSIHERVQSLTRVGNGSDGGDSEEDGGEGSPLLPISSSGSSNRGGSRRMNLQSY